MTLKDAITIALVTLGVIGGACCGIVGGASGIAGAAAAIHYFADSQGQTKLQ